MNNNGKTLLEVPALNGCSCMFYLEDVEMIRAGEEYAIVYLYNHHGTYTRLTLESGNYVAQALRDRQNPPTTPNIKFEENLPEVRWNRMETRHR